MRYLIVCVDKTWGQSGCQPWTGDWVDEVWLQPGQYVDSPYFTPNTVLTAVTSSDAGYYYKVEIIDQNGNVVKTCDYVDRNNPCYYYVSAPPSPSSSPIPSPSPSPPPSPTPSPSPSPSTSPSPPPSPSPSPQPSPSPSPSPTPSISMTDLLIAAGVFGAAALIGFGITYAVRQAGKK